MDKLEKIGHKADSYVKDILNEYELDWGVVSNAYIAGYEQARADLLRKAKIAFCKGCCPAAFGNDYCWNCNEDCCQEFLDFVKAMEE